MRLVALAMAGFTACALVACSHGETPRPAVERGHVASNILRDDYAGSTECQYCHKAIYAAWAGSPMRRMTRRAGTAQPRAPFDGGTFTFMGDTATMTTVDGREFMRLQAAIDGEHLYRVTKLIGGRVREDYVGIDVTAAADPVNDPGKGAEKVLPVSWVFATSSWRYKGYSVMVPERPGLRAGPVWAQTCIACHNTLPLVDLLLDDVAPRNVGYAGAVEDGLLPPERRWHAHVLDEEGLTAALRREIIVLGGKTVPAAAPLLAVVAATVGVIRRRLDGTHLVEVGVGCESCHAGSRAHTDNPKLRPSFTIESSLVAVGPTGGAQPTRAEAINRTCARCHTVLFSGYPFTWEGGHRRDAVPGGSSISSGEARDFLLGGCARQLACTTCHDPHAKDSRAHYDELASVRGNRVCQGCHTQFATPATLAAHTHHKPDGAGSACIACHMAKKNMSLTYALGRYHRIGSPTDKVRVEQDRPLECALCHADKSVGDLVGNMESWWGKHYDRAALATLYGNDLGVNALVRTLAVGKPHEQAAAMMTLADAHVVSAVPLIVPMLWHEYPLVRYFARTALETLTGAPVDVQVDNPTATVKADAERWLATRP